MDGLEKFSFDQDQVAALKNEAVRNHSCASRISFAMALDLLRRFYAREHYWPFVDELYHLEDSSLPSSTKAEAQFNKCSPLYPFWHKNVFTAKHLLKNLGVRWSLDRSGNRDLDDCMTDVAEKFGDCPDTWPSVLVDRIVLGGFQDRQGRLTGDWIVFRRFEEQNCYLALTSHEEAKDSAALLKRIRQNCQAEFPFCFSEQAEIIE
jgi:hypothetical protein